MKSEKIGIKIFSAISHMGNKKNNSREAKNMVHHCEYWRMGELELLCCHNKI
jgi:hypothetical protein